MQLIIIGCNFLIVEISSTKPRTRFESRCLAVNRRRAPMIQFRFKSRLRFALTAGFLIIPLTVSTRPQSSVSSLSFGRSSVEQFPPIRRSWILVGLFRALVGPVAGGCILASSLSHHAGRSSKLPCLQRMLDCASVTSIGIIAGRLASLFLSCATPSSAWNFPQRFHSTPLPE